MKYTIIIFCLIIKSFLQLESLFKKLNTQVNQPELNKVQENTNNINVDGKWIIRTDWSQCSALCNGGTQILERVCISAKGTGKPCDGPSILIRNCNTKPCEKKKEIKIEGMINSIDELNTPVYSNILDKDKPDEQTKITNQISPNNINFVETKAKTMEKSESTTYEKEKLLLKSKIINKETESIELLNKDNYLSSLLQIEENQKEKKEDEVLLEKLEYEREKERKLLGILQNETRKNAEKLQKENMEKRINEIDAKTNQILTKRRDTIKKILMKAKLKNEVKKTEIEKSIQAIRSNMFNQFNKITSKDINVCFANTNDINYINSYCNKIDYVSKYNSQGKLVNNEILSLQKRIIEECKTPEGFCYSCCDNEIGEIMIKEREDCYDKCDGSNNIK